MGALRKTLVTEEGDGGTLAHWTSTFNIDTEALDALRPAMTNFYLRGLDGLEASVRHTNMRR